MDACFPASSDFDSIFGRPITDIYGSPRIRTLLVPRDCATLYWQRKERYEQHMVEVQLILSDWILALLGSPHRPRRFAHLRRYIWEWLGRFVDTFPLH